MLRFYCSPATRKRRSRASFARPLAAARYPSVQTPCSLRWQLCSFAKLSAKLPGWRLYGDCQVDLAHWQPGSDGRGLVVRRAGTSRGWHAPWPAPRGPCWLSVRTVGASLVDPRLCCSTETKLESMGSRNGNTKTYEKSK